MSTLQAVRTHLIFAILVLGAVMRAAVATPCQHVGPADAAVPTRDVVVGMYLRDVPEVDLRAGTFAFDAYLWFRWEPAQFLAIGAEPSEDPSGLPRAPSESYEVMGVHELQTTAVSSRPGYAVFRVQGKVRQSFDLGRFPLDDHVLGIRVEDAENEIHRVRYVPDVEGSTAGHLTLHGWATTPLRVEAGTEEFATNFGDLELPTGTKSVYSAVTFQIGVNHDGVAYFAKLTCTAFIAAILSMLALLIRPSDVDPRFGLPVGGLFAAVASEWAVSEALPDRSGLTMADWIHVASFLAIFVVVLVSVFSLRHFEAGREEGSRRLDRLAFWGLLPSYAVSILLIVWLR
jgi:hypothetical protein